MGRGGRLPVALLALLVAGGIFVQSGSTSGGQSGGIFRISFTPMSGLDHIDPALSVLAARRGRSSTRRARG